MYVQCTFNVRTFSVRTMYNVRTVYNQLSIIIAPTRVLLLYSAVLGVDLESVVVGDGSAGG